LNPNFDPTKAAELSGRTLSYLLEQLNTAINAESQEVAQTAAGSGSPEAGEPKRSG